MTAAATAFEGLAAFYGVMKEPPTMATKEAAEQELGDHLDALCTQSPKRVNAISRHSAEAMPKMKKDKDGSQSHLS